MVREPLAIPGQEMLTQSPIMKNSDMRALPLLWCAVGIFGANTTSSINISTAARVACQLNGLAEGDAEECTPASFPSSKTLLYRSKVPHVTTRGTFERPMGMPVTASNKGPEEDALQCCLPRGVSPHCLELRGVREGGLSQQLRCPFAVGVQCLVLEGEGACRQVRVLSAFISLFQIIQGSRTIPHHEHNTPRPPNKKLCTQSSPPQGHGTA